MLAKNCEQPSVNYHRSQVPRANLRSIIACAASKGHERVLEFYKAAQATLSEVPFDNEMEFKGESGTFSRLGRSNSRVSLVGAVVTLILLAVKCFTDSNNPSHKPYSLVPSPCF